MLLYRICTDFISSEGGKWADLWDVPGSDPSYWSPWWMILPSVESRPRGDSSNDRSTALAYGFVLTRYSDDVSAQNRRRCQTPKTGYLRLYRDMYNCCCSYAYLCSADSEITGLVNTSLAMSRPPSTAAELVCIRHIAFMVYTVVWTQNRTLERYAASIKLWWK